MIRGQFLRRLRKYCRKLGLSISVEESRGKGSHVTVEVEDRRTIVKGGEFLRSTSSWYCVSWAYRTARFSASLLEEEPRCDFSIRSR